MKVKDFLNDAGVVTQMNRLKKLFVNKNKQVSDIVDEAGHQYVDLVMEGGGVLGIALVGYTYALEQAGIRFLGIGGTSAGAINALLLAGLAPPDQERSVKVLKALAELEMFKFVDGDDDAVDFVEALVKGAGKLRLVLKGMQIIDNLTDHLGLNPGDEFLKWIRGQLESNNITSLAKLEKCMEPPSLFLRDGTKLSASQAGSMLGIVAADITTESKVVFPQMSALYWRQHRDESPACYARASMSIPGFFEPYRVPQIPGGARAQGLWKKHTGYTGTLPTEVLFADGGIMSNFPIDLFHTPNKVPTAPTFGAKLGVDRSAPREIDKLPALLGAVFDAARHCADYDFITKHPDYRHLLTYIQTGEHNWLDFFLEKDAKIDLFRRGVKAAVDFLDQFDWADYKLLRAELIAANKASEKRKKK